MIFFDEIFNKNHLWFYSDCSAVAESESVLIESSECKEAGKGMKLINLICKADFQIMECIIDLHSYLIGDDRQAINHRLACPLLIDLMHLKFSENSCC